MLNKINNKFMIFIILLVSFVFSLSITSKAETYDADDMWDVSVYDRDWSKGNIETWIIKRDVKYLWWTAFTKTTVAIKVSDKEGNLINNLVRLECKYWIDGEQYHVRRENDGSSNWFKFGNVASEEGQFGTMTDDINEHFIEHSDSFEKPYDEDANYIWAWNYNIEKLEYMYVWFEVDGEEYAASFYANGEHPMYDETGEFIGIYDENGNLVDGMTLNENGIPVYSDSMEEVELATQVQGEIKIESSGLDSFTEFMKDPLGNLKQTISDAIATPLKMIGLVVGILITLIIAKWLIDLFSKISIIKSNRRK